MSILEILLEIPPEIQAGLDNGTLVRDAAGVIRHAKGFEHAGEIVAHLKEIQQIIREEPQLSATVSSMLGPMAAMVGVTVISTALVLDKLNKIDRKLDRILKGQEQMLRGIDDIINFNLKSLTVELFQARQFFLNEDYDNALIFCNKSAGKLTNYLSTNSIEYHLDHRDELDYLLNALACTAEIHCKAKNIVDNSKISKILTIYYNIINELFQKFNLFSNETRNYIRNKIPLPDELRKLKLLKNRSTELKNCLNEAVSICRAEIQAIDAIQNLNTNQLNQLQHSKYMYIPIKN